MAIQIQINNQQINNQANPPHGPRIRRANWISFCIIVTRFAWIAHKFASSKRWTMNASVASCRARMAWLCQRRGSWLFKYVKSVATSRTSLAKGSFLRSNDVLFWKCLISRRATVPGRYLFLGFTLAWALLIFWIVFLATGRAGDFLEIPGCSFGGIWWDVCTYLVKPSSESLVEWIVLNRFIRKMLKRWVQGAKKDLEEWI